MHISPNDSRQYRHITLKNGLRLLLINDVQAPRSAAALSIGVGHFCDPTDRQGMAHFLEHMLFLGTKKYPSIGEFQSFTSRHGGTNNAWTGTENTTFFFDIQHEYFHQALDRFAHFFIDPLFNADAVEKERNAVDSEYRLKINDDVRRIYQVQKETINPRHPFAKFSVGNKDTLADTKHRLIRDELITFFHQHYSANLMTVAIISPLELDALSQIATTCFENIINLRLTPFVPQEVFVEKKQLEQFIFIKPLKDIKKLTLSFNLPCIDNLYKTKPLSYIAHLLGYEGTGSVTSLLKSKGYINNLTAGGGIRGSNFREFTISMGLTQIGLSHVDDIICYIFQTINLIKNRGLAAWRYDEKRAVQELNFYYQEPIRPIDNVSHLVVNMHHYEECDILYGDSMMQGYDESSVRQMLSYLTFEHLRVILISQQGQFTHNAKWYDTPYRIQNFTKQQCDKWQEQSISPALTLPEPNPYICYSPQALTLESPTKTLPQCIKEDPALRLWHLQDTAFRVPKGVVYISIDSPYAVASIENIVKTRISVEMLLESINESAYLAEVAGLSYNLYAHQGGVTLKLSGFTEKLPLLLDLILDKFSQRSFKPERFEHIKNQLVRGFKNATKDKPINRLYNQMTGILQPNNPTYEQLIDALEPLKVTELPEFVKKVLRQLHIEMFVYGNWQRQQAIELADKVQQTLYVDDQIYQDSKRPLVLLKGAGSASYSITTDSQDSAMLIYYQSQTTTATDVALFTFAHHLISAIFFEELRTKQQLGYVVGSGNMPLNRHPGIIFYVQSPKVGPSKLIEAIDDFLNAFFLVLLQLSEEKWQASKHGILSQIQEPDVNLRSCAQRFWIGIGNKDIHFENRKNVAKEIAHMQRADMVRFIVEKLKPRTADRLILHCCATAHKDQNMPPNSNTITSISAFRNQQIKSD